MKCLKRLETCRISQITHRYRRKYVIPIYLCTSIGCCFILNSNKKTINFLHFLKKYYTLDIQDTKKAKNSREKYRKELCEKKKQHTVMAECIELIKIYINISRITQKHLSG